MSSFIHYKFKSAKDFDTYRFDGAGVPVWELKQEIIKEKKLGKGLDFDLVISNAQTNEDYLSETLIILKNTSVLVKRVPGVRNPNKMVSSKQLSYDQKTEILLASQQIQTPGNAFAGYFPTRSSTSVAKADDDNVDTSIDEDAMIEAMMNASSAAWSQNQQQIGGEGFRPRAFRPHRPPTPASLPPPPPNYVCFRCGQKGHYIAYCPTNTDPNFDKPRLKKTTGIPRSFLRTVNPEEQSGGMLVTADGNVVIAVSNDQEWQKISSSTTSKNTSINTSLIPLDLKCKICSNLLNDPTCCPNCSTAFCEECILKEGIKDISCPECHAMFNADQLVPSETLSKRVTDFITEQQKPTPLPSAPPNIPQMIPPFPFPLPPFPFMPLPPFIRPPVPTDSKEVKERSRSPDRRSRRNQGRGRSRSRSRSRSPPRRSFRRN